MLRKMHRGLLCPAVLLSALSASAQVVTFEFCGQSIYGTPMAPVGTPVSGRFSWDIAAPALEPAGSVDNMRLAIMSKQPYNMSLDTETPPQEAAPPHMLRAGQLQR